MEYTTIPSISKKVSRIGLGAWAIGGSLWGGTDEKESIATIRRAFDKGINLIDTAPAYGKGKSEEIVGKAIKEHGKRENIIIATKCGLNQETESVFRDSSKRYILKEIEESLARLQVEYIDIYQIHWPDPTTPLAETAEVMNKLYTEGKIKAIGVSNFSIEQMDEFRKFAPIHTLQPPFNIFEREMENEILGYCLESDIGVISYSALCRGLLSGKMSKDRKFQGDDFRSGMDPKFTEPSFSQYVNAANALREWVEKQYHKPLIALAIRWILDSDVNVALWGARKPEQLADIDTVLDWELTGADFKEIDKIIAQHIKTPMEPKFMAPPIREKIKQFD